MAVPAGQPGTDKQLELMVDHDRDHDKMLRRALLVGMLGDHAPPEPLVWPVVAFSRDDRLRLRGRGVDAVPLVSSHSSRPAGMASWRAGKWLP
jgi:hypothetical protein